MACAHPINLYNSFGSGLSGPTPLSWMQQEPWLESAINFPFCELHCLGGFLSYHSGIWTSGITVTSCCSVAKSCLTLCNAMDCSPPDSSAHWILQTRIMEWVAMPSSRGSPQPRNWTHVSHISCTGMWVLYHKRHLGSPVLTLLPPSLSPSFLCVFLLRLFRMHASLLQ